MKIVLFIVCVLVATASSSSFAIFDGPTEHRSASGCGRVSRGSIRTEVAVYPPQALASILISVRPVADPAELRFVVFYGGGAPNFPILAADPAGLNHICRALGFQNLKPQSAVYLAPHESVNGLEERRVAMMFPWGDTAKGKRTEYRAVIELTPSEVKARSLTEEAYENLFDTPFVKEGVCQNPEQAGLVAELLRPGPSRVLSFAQAPLPLGQDVTYERTSKEQWSDYWSNFFCGLTPQFPGPNVR
jgi:hypothetical protein